MLTVLCLKAYKNFFSVISNNRIQNKVNLLEVYQSVQCKEFYK